MVSVLSPLRAILVAGALFAGFASPWLGAEPVISEFLAANTTTLADEDGAYPDWIELYNPDSATVDLNGWYLTDTATNKTKWQFPAITLGPRSYLVVFASDKNRRDPLLRLHTNFSLDADGEYLALIKPDGATPTSEFAPKFAPQQANVSYGFAGSATAGSRVYLLKPTPGAVNSVAGPIGLVDTPTFSQAAGPFRTSFSLTLSGAKTGQQIRYVITPAATAARAATPTNASPLYTSPIAVSTSVLVSAAIFTTDGSTRGPVRSVSYSQISPALASATSALPVFVIDTLGSGALTKDGSDHPAWLHVYPARTNNAPIFGSSPSLVSPLTITVRGATSAQFPKKSYNFQFTNELGYRDAPVVLDLPAQEKWALVGPWKYDPAYLNNPFAYELSTSLGRWAPRTRLAELYCNANGNEVDPADYAGVYVLTDRIEVGKRRVDLANLTPEETSGNDLTGGYILKIDTKDPDEIGWTTNRWRPNEWGTTLVLVHPSAEDIAPAQLTYIRDYVQRMENALLADRDANWARRTYTDYLDRASWVDHHLLNTFVANPDALQRSAYFCKDREGRITAGPVWDFDRALGCDTDDDVRSYRFDVWSGVGAADVWQSGWWGILATDPEFMQDWVDRWQSLRRTTFANDKLTTLLDTLAANLAAAAARDAARWPDNASAHGNFVAHLSYLKHWVTQRAEWIDHQFLAAPEITPVGNTLVFTPPAGAQLVYTLDGSDPRSLGGAIAPNAAISSQPYTVPASTNIHVRSYDVRLRGTFPGSTWSSAVGSASSSPLSPVARLVNLSSRAVVGSGENALIAGVVVSDTEAKRYLCRAIGPALATFGANDYVPDPQLIVFGDRGNELFRNRGWGTGTDASKLPSYSRSVGAFALPTNSQDSALANAFAAGGYTLQVTTPTSRAGVGLVELYELDDKGRTVNLSTRAQVRAGDGVLIGGFVVQGPAYKRVLIRAVGPTLASFGVSGVLRDPVLTVYQGQNIVATNDRWQAASNATAITSASRIVGAFDLTPDGEDAALFMTVPPGAYTLKVAGKNDTEGVALLEVYEVP